jgi:hypothetical protein
MLRGFPLDQALDLERRYYKLDTSSREYVSDVINGYAGNAFLAKGKTPTRIAAYLIAATIAAPVFSGHGGRHGIHTATSFAESLSLNIAHAFKMSAETINWANREIINYTLGTALVVAAGRMDATSFENVIWLGQNSEKLVPLIDRIAEVSAERDYLQPMMTESPNPLNQGAI